MPRTVRRARGAGQCSGCSVAVAPSIGLAHDRAFAAHLLDEITLPSCFASSSSPTFTLMVFWSEDRLARCQVTSEHFQLRQWRWWVLLNNCRRPEIATANSDPSRGTYNEPSQMRRHTLRQRG